MKVTNIVNIDLSIRQNIPFVDAVQGDSARAIEFRLFDRGQPFNVPDGSAVLIRYKRPDGFGGVYDTLPNGETAYSISSNKVTAALSPTALGVAGNVDFQVTVSNGEDLISAFALEIRVDADPSADVVDAEDYINISQFVTEESKKNAPYIGDNGNWWVNQEDTGVKAGGGSGGGGADGFSPVAKVTQTDSGATITVTDKNGTTTATVTNGKDGKDGEKGDTGATGAKGDKGDPGADGKDGTNGKDGTSVTVKSVSESAADGGSNVVTFSDGKTVTIKNGTKGSTGSKGDKGDKGDTGETGAAGKDGLDATPVTPLFANSIDECTDTSKFYVLPDGFIYAYQYVEATGPSYTNLAGTITYDRRLSSSGKASSSALTGACYTGFIPVKKGDVVRIKGLNIKDDLSSSAYPYFCFYTGASESNVVSSNVYVVPSQHGAPAFNGLADSANGGIASWTAFAIGNTNGTIVQHSLASSITHIRISGKYFADTDVIVTVNEEITEGGSGGYAWVNTGHAFVPADYEAEILALQKNKADKTAIPTKLPNPNALTIDGVKYDGSAAVNIETQAGGNILYGKKWVACGDSFTANGYNASDGFDESVYIYQDGRFAGRYKVYPNIIGLRNNMNIVNLATGGQTMAASSNSFMTRYANIDADADYITIMLGINDKVQGLAVGALEDSTNTTFCGAFNIAMEHILENHPFAHIGIMVSHGTNEEIMEATRGIAERWGVPYLDYGSPQVPLMNRYTGRNVCAKAQEIREKNFCVISDGTTATNGHPNTAAHEYESTFIEAWLRTL